MAPSSKTSASRRKLTRGIVVLKVSPKALQNLHLKFNANTQNSRDSSTSLMDLPPTSSLSTSENTHSSKSRTPDQPETPGSASMLPPADGVKKKGSKRSSNAAFGSENTSASKARGKPGPKKKSKLDDVTPDQSITTSRAFNATAIKLGPKANQGAINAGLRALDRSGKPCRKWAKESFKLKSFTGVCWEIPRWRAPPKAVVIKAEGDSHSGSTSTEIKAYSEAESEQSEKSQSIDIESGSTSSKMLCSPVSQPLSSGETINTSVHMSSVVTASA